MQHPRSRRRRAGRRGPSIGVLVAGAVGAAVVVLVGAVASGPGTEPASALVGSRVDARVDARVGSRGDVAVIAEVSDGDTIDLRNGTSVRLIGIDTPETQNPDFGDECYGHSATRFARTLLHPGDRVRLVRDVEIRDRYDRLLAYVYRARDNLFVNAEIVRRGYAYVSTIPPNVAHAEKFRRLAAEARDAGRGLWSECAVKGSTGGERPPPSKKHCLPQYRGACVPPPPPDYDCSDFNGPITVTGHDVHRLDSDGDGIACAGSE